MNKQMNIHHLLLETLLGDHLYKRNEKLKPEDQMISALPDIQHRKLSR